MSLKKNIEPYGIYCGKYMSSSDCSNDSNCQWNSSIGKGWCDIAPPSTEEQSNSINSSDDNSSDNSLNYRYRFKRRK